MMRTKLEGDREYRGYIIRPALHPTTFNPGRVAYDIVDGDRIRRGNISTVETCRKVIDTMIRYGYWRDSTA